MIPRELEPVRYCISAIDSADKDGSTHSTHDVSAMLTLLRVKLTRFRGETPPRARLNLGASHLLMHLPRQRRIYSILFSANFWPHISSHAQRSLRSLVTKKLNTIREPFLYSNQFFFT